MAGSGLQTEKEIVWEAFSDGSGHVVIAPAVHEHVAPLGLAPPLEQSSCLAACLAVLAALLLAAALAAALVSRSQLRQRKRR